MEVHGVSLCVSSLIMKVSVTDSNLILKCVCVVLYYLYFMCIAKDKLHMYGTRVNSTLTLQHL